ncbi:myelin-associated glycoprotein-like isoform X1 [Myripristis murdjan]|uniref:myelin-associated glycoprotein-like isoform X1 n=1 Tax=Myripristis murdjan TaxID=586833 RepID=UPI00117628F3|nr:myelin-associated glycoprotein-like isoform X1 [Myripristis murdjan]
MTMGFHRGLHFLFIQVLWSVFAEGNKWKVTLPSRLSALTGSCLVVPCSFTHPSSHTPHSASWYLYSKMPSRYPLVYSSTRPEAVEAHFRGRTKLLGNVTHGTCTLLITEVTAQHNGEAIYPWIDNVGFKFYHTVVTLDVSETAAKPVMTISGELVEGHGVTVSCEVRHSCPLAPPTLSFERHGGEATVNSTEEGDGRWRLLSTITFIATAEDHGRPVGCKVTFPGGQKATTDLVLHVSYSPRSVNISADKTGVRVGTNVSLTCVSDANPPASSYRWYDLKGGTLICLNQSAETITISIADPEDSIFHCTAINNLGRANSTAAFVVAAEYEPTVLPESNCSYHIGRMICKCAVKARPLAAVYWRVDGQPEASTSASAVSHLSHIVEETWSTAGATENMSVICVVNNTHGQQEVLLRVFVKAPPTNVSIAQSPARPMVGETAALFCRGQGHPPLSLFRWYRMQGEGSIQLAEKSERLSLSELTRDIVSFRCLAINEMGESTSPVTVVNVEYAPIILPESSCSVLNEVIRCECVVDSHPAATVTWTPLNTDHNRTFNINSQLNGKILTSVLTAPKSENMSDVICNMTNEHGSALLELSIRGESRQVPSGVFGGVGFALVLLLGFILFSFWMFYTRQKHRNTRHVDYSMEEVELRTELEITYANTNHAGVPAGRVHWI